MNLRDKLGVLRSAPVAGPYGSETRSWAGVEPITYPAHVGPLSASERLVNQDRVGTKLKATLPADADITAADRGLYHGDEYEIDGVETLMAQGVAHHKSAVLSRVTGG